MPVVLNEVSKVIGHRLEEQDSILSREKYSSLRQHGQNGSQAHLASYSVGASGSFHMGVATVP